MKLKSITQTYKDGILSVYTVDNVADSGNTPKEELTLKVGFLRYDELKVGVTRFWAASQDQSKVEQLLRTPRLDFVYRDDVIIPKDGKQYRIVQIQYPSEIEPSSMDLSLERVTVAYDIGGS